MRITSPGKYMFTDAGCLTDYLADANAKIIYAGTIVEVLATSTVNGIIEVCLEGLGWTSRDLPVKDITNGYKAFTRFDQIAETKLLTYEPS